MKSKESDKSPVESILVRAAERISEAAAARDNKAGERSMARSVRAFKGLTGHSLTEREGWVFMAVLKLARAQAGGEYNEDDYVDGAAYMALAGEAGEKEGVFREAHEVVMNKTLPDEMEKWLLKGLWG